MINRKMNVMVTDYDKKWVQLFHEEAVKIRAILQDEIVDIHHIGSTAVPDLQAKPIIDIMPTVKDIEKVDTFNEKMVEMGYEPLGENDIQGRRYFRKGGENRTHQLHFFQSNNHTEIERHLAVRDYLRSHRKDLLEYGKLKEQLAKKFPCDIEGYCDGKDLFVKNLERKALEWRKLDRG